MSISLIWAANKTAGIEFILHFINAALLIYVILQKYDSNKLISILLNSCFYSALAFCVLFYFERYVLGHTNYNVGNYSPIGFMNNAGAVFNIWIPALILFAIKQYKVKNKLLLTSSIIVTLLIVSILMEAATRGTIIGLSICELIIFAITFRKNKKMAFIYLAITTLLLSGMITYKLFDALQSGRLEGKMLAISHNIADSSGQRIQLFKNTWEMTLDNPMGVGVNNFEFTHPKYGKPNTKDASPYINERQVLTSPHNLLLKIYSELGLVFGSVFAILILYLLISALINAVRGGYIDKWLFVGLGATFFHSMVSAVIITPVSLFFSAILISVIIKRSTELNSLIFINKLFAKKNVPIPATIKLTYCITPLFFCAMIASHYLAHNGIINKELKNMQRAVSINPYNARALYRLSFYELGANHNVEQSLTYIDQFLLGYPYHIAGLLIKSERHFQLKEYRLAENSINKLLSFYPTFKKAQRLKRQILLKKNNT
jgi:tetratricopeptide (TPR) repeat protein